MQREEARNRYKGLGLSLCQIEVLVPLFTFVPRRRCQRQSQSIRIRIRPKWPAMHGFLFQLYASWPTHTHTHWHTLWGDYNINGREVCAREFIHLLVTVLTTPRRPTSQEQEDIAGSQQPALYHPNRIKKFRIRIRLPHNWITGCVSAWAPDGKWEANLKFYTWLSIVVLSFHTVSSLLAAPPNEISILFG